MFGKFDLANTVLVGMSQSVSVKPELCNRMCHKSSKCSLCETNCPVGAITVGSVGTNIKIDWEKCTYCAICVNICPVGVYGIREMSYKKFLATYVAAISEDGVLRLGCEEQKRIAEDTDIRTKIAQNTVKNEESSVLVSCMGIFGVPDILYFYVHGAKKIIFHFPKCENCQNIYGKSILEDEIYEFKKLIPCFEHLEDTAIDIDEDTITITFPLQFPKHLEIKSRAEEIKAEPVTRRGMFDFMYKNATDTALKSAVFLTPQNLPEKTPFRDKKELSAKRKIFIESIIKCGKLLQDTIKPGSYFFSQTIDSDSCKRCKICTRFCPSGALHLDEDENIVFAAAECVSCGMCLISCYHKYIKADKEVNLKTFYQDVIKVPVKEK